MKNYMILSFLVAVFSLLSCSHKYTYVVADNSGNNINAITGATAGYNNNSEQDPTVQKTVGTMLKASAFKMNGDYSDNVAITIGPNGIITYFPAPTDIKSDSKPLALGNGWWLNRQGIGPNSVFTKYTFDEYMNLKEVPSINELKNAVIPDSRVVEFIQLPWPASTEESNLEEIKEYVKTK